MVDLYIVTVQKYFGGGGGSLILSSSEHSHVGSLFSIEEPKQVGS